MIIRGNSETSQYSKPIGVVSQRRTTVREWTSVHFGDRREGEKYLYIHRVTFLFILTFSILNEVVLTNQDNQTDLTGQTFKFLIYVFYLSKFGKKIKFILCMNNNKYVLSVDLNFLISSPMMYPSWCDRGSTVRLSTLSLPYTKMWFYKHEPNLCLIHRHTISRYIPLHINPWLYRPNIFIFVTLQFSLLIQICFFSLDAECSRKIIVHIGKDDFNRETTQVGTSKWSSTVHEWIESKDLSHMN